jgi:hypothetical protein
MWAVDWKQIPNLEQVMTAALVPLGLVSTLFLILFGVLWGQVRLLRRRVDELEAYLKDRAGGGPGR